MQHALVWFKRDLRINDHLPLAQAAKRGRVTCAYFIEPSLWRAPDMATQHYRFILESLHDLQGQLSSAGLRLTVLVGESVQCLERIRAIENFSEIFSHEETGNAMTYARDKEVARWCRTNSIRWQQYPQFGVRRGPHNRDHWKTSWQDHSSAPLIKMPDNIQCSLLSLSDPAPTSSELGLVDPDPTRRQRGGVSLAKSTLEEFLYDRSSQYRGGISSPLSAPTACSRLSAYLSYGCISMREIFHATQEVISNLPPNANHRRRGLQSFVSRLYWHCHFIQKLEDEPEIEWCNMHRGYDGLREHQWSSERFDALVSGRTGWPLVDACIAMLRETGWLNFRMRAMLVSVAAYPLWLHWREVGLWLARQFLDYEPGIHWSQMQMQSGTTGINIPRIYNPIKQARDHDPKGLFVRRWLPAMRRVPQTWIFEPWRMPENVQLKYGVRVPTDIAAPVCDIEVATRDAKSKIFERRNVPAVRQAKNGIVQKHGSRKQLEPKHPAQTTKRGAAQLSWDF